MNNKLIVIASLSLSVLLNQSAHIESEHEDIYISKSNMEQNGDYVNVIADINDKKTDKKIKRTYIIDCVNKLLSTSTGVFAEYEQDSVQDKVLKASCGMWQND